MRNRFITAVVVSALSIFASACTAEADNEDDLDGEVESTEEALVALEYDEGGARNPGAAKFFRGPRGAPPLERTMAREDS